MCNPFNSYISTSHRVLLRQAKIALQVHSEDQMLELEAIAKSLNLCAKSIQDA